MRLPFRDEKDARGNLKRTYWPRGDADVVRRKVASEVKGLRTKKGTNYSRADQKKIAAEKWQKVCEMQAPVEAFFR